MLYRPITIAWRTIPNEERTRLILAHCKTGMSAGQVGEIIGGLGISGHTRNSIISHIYRRMKDSGFSLGARNGNPRPWGTVKGSVPVERRRPPMPIRVKVKAKPAAPRYVRPRPSECPPESRGLTCEELGTRSCRYIAGDPREGGTYCGHETLPDESWCSYHMSIVYQPSRAA